MVIFHSHVSLPEGMIQKTAEMFQACSHFVRLDVTSARCLQNSGHVADDFCNTCCLFVPSGELMG